MGFSVTKISFILRYLTPAKVICNTAKDTFHNLIFLLTRDIFDVL